jgi:hypothetical protein
MHPRGLLASFCTITTFGVAAAQTPDVPTEAAPTPAATPPPAPAPVATATTTAAPPPAADGEQIGTAFGVGAQALLTGPTGPALVYNTNRFHIEGLFAFSDVNDASSFTIAGRAWLHIHNSPRASLSVGGGGGLQNADSEPMAGAPSEKTSNLILEGGAQIRFFVTRNVAISASAGLGIISGDADALAVTGQVTGAFGITYFID